MGKLGEKGSVEVLHLGAGRACRRQGDDQRLSGGRGALGRAADPDDPERHAAVHSLLVNSGSTLNRSPTRPMSATWKIGASSSLLIAMIVLESFMPARCWIAPEMPTAT